MTTRPRGAHSVRAESVSIGCDGVRIVEGCFRGHHVYKNLWEASLGEELRSKRERESGNKTP